MRWGKPDPKPISLEDGTYLVRLYAIINLGLIKSKNYNSQSSRTIFGFETIEKFKTFKDEYGPQPHGIQMMFFKGQDATNFFKELVERALTDEEKSEGFNPMTVLGKCFSVVVENVERNGTTYLEITKSKFMLEEKDAAEKLAHADKEATLNKLTLFHPAVISDMTTDPSEWSAPASAEDQVNSPEFKRLTKKNKATVVTSAEFKALEGAGEYPPTIFTE